MQRTNALEIGEELRGSSFVIVPVKILVILEIQESRVGNANSFKIY